MLSLARGASEKALDDHEQGSPRQKAGVQDRVVGSGGEGMGFSK